MEELPAEMYLALTAYSIREAPTRVVHIATLKIIIPKEECKFRVRKRSKRKDVR